MLSLIAAGVASLPFFGWAIASLPVLAVCSIVPLAVLVFHKSATTTSSSSDNDSSTCLSTSSPCNVIITGGSSGIGLAIAKECCRLERVKNITLIARNLHKLEAAKQALLDDLQLASKKQRPPGIPEIQVLSADVSDYDSVAKAIESIEMLDATYLFVCAGVSHPGYFDKLPPQVFQDQVNINYLGSVYTIKAALPNMRSGCIILTSSAAGQVGVFGFTAYAPTKFALQGLAQSLHMELLASHNSAAGGGVRVQLAFPNDTNTPGYKEEQARKPRECHLISESAGLSEAKDIAQKMVRESLLSSNPSFTISFGVEGWMLTALTAGMGPVTSLWDAITQVTLMGVFRLVSLFYLHDFGNIVQRCAREDDAQSKKKEEEKKRQ